MKPFRRSSSRFLWMAALIPPVALLAAPAMAQSASDAAAAADDNVIIVTAQKRSESIDKVGMSITAITGEALQTQQIKNVADLANIVPGLTYTTSQFNTPIYNMRGVGFYDTSLGSYPTVSIYVDQVPLPFSAMTPAASLDVQRLEALKGPQGILFGQNSTGGAINYVANKPTKSFAAGMELGYGRFNALDAQGYISGPLTPTLGARLAMSGSRADGWQYSYARTGADTKNGKVRRLAGRLLLDWDPSDDFKAELSVGGWIDDSDPLAAQLVGRDPQYGFGVPFANPAFLTFPLAPANPRAADWSPGQVFGRQRQYQGSLRMDYDITDGVTLTSLTSYVRYKRHAGVDGDGYTGHDQDTYSIRAKASSLFQELRLANDPKNRARWVIGGNYQQDRADENDLIDYSGSQVPLLFGFGSNGFFGNQRMKNYAGFGNIEVDILPRLTLKGGARYTQANRSFVGCVYDDGDGQLAFGFDNISAAIRGVPYQQLSAPGDCVLLDEVTFLPGDYREKLNQHSVSWRVGADYRVSDTTLLYANVAKGYKAGSFPVQGVSLTSAYHPVVQESVLNYEAGFKSRLLGNHLSLTGSIFYYDYTNKQLLAKILDPIFNVLPALVNVPKSSVFGVEASADLTPVRGLRLSLSGNYLDAKVDKFTGVNQTGQLANFDHTRMPFTPKWQIVHMGDYRFPINDGLEAFAGYTVNYRSQTNSSVGGGATTNMTGYTLLDVRAGLETEDGRYRLTVWGKNVTNKYYWTNTVRNNNSIVRYAGMPATYGFTIARKW